MSERIHGIHLKGIELAASKSKFLLTIQWRLLRFCRSHLPSEAGSVTCIPRNPGKVPVETGSTFCGAHGSTKRLPKRRAAGYSETSPAFRKGLLILSTGRLS